MLWIIIGTLASYCIGSVPTAYLFCRMIKGVDIRTIGSGNVGATNAARILGKKTGLIILLLDIVKGIVAVAVLGTLLYPHIRIIIADKSIIMIIFGISAICGHNWPVFLNFKGGKGVATTIGVLIGLAISLENMRIILGLMILTWAVFFLITRIVSIASIIAAVSLPIYLAVFKYPALLLSFSVVLATFIVLRHIPNLKRLREGKENKLL